MQQMKLALDSTTERELLIDLWKIEELVQEDKNKKGSTCSAIDRTERKNKTRTAKSDRD